MVKSAHDRKAIKQLFLNYICPTHTDWLFFSYWLSSLILSSLLVMPLPLRLSILQPPRPPVLHLVPLPIFCRQPCQCFKMTRVAEEPPLPDPCHCLLHQLPCPSTINFDVEPNEIRPRVEAEADSCLREASPSRRG